MAQVQFKQSAIKSRADQVVWLILRMADLDKPLQTIDMSGADSSAEARTALGGFVAQAGAAAAQRAAEDPQVREQVAASAAAGAGAAFQAAQQGAARAFGEFNAYIQMGPTGVSMLCTFGAIGTIVVAIIDCLSIAGILTNPAQYVLNLYLFIFGITMILIEADTQRMTNFALLRTLAPRVSRLQAFIFREVHIISGLVGRGMFYLFVGLFCVTECWWCLTFLAGLFNCVNGVLCIASGMKNSDPRAQGQAYSP
uniref:Uncharacterized protein n=1 Tax=Noctiluca scintillans TaxID=2966 RepID=A0A7S1AY93_NOCSC